MSAERFFDDLARTLAEPMPRRRAVRIIGVSLAALAIPGVSPNVARASLIRPRGRGGLDQAKCPDGSECSPGSVCCDEKSPYGGYTCRYPNQTCCCGNTQCDPGERCICPAPGGVQGVCLPKCKLKDPFSFDCGVNCCKSYERCVDGQCKPCETQSCQPYRSGRTICCPKGTDCCANNTSAVCCGKDQICKAQRVKTAKCVCKKGTGTKCGTDCCTKRQTCCRGEECCNSDETCTPQGCCPPDRTVCRDGSGGRPICCGAGEFCLWKGDLSSDGDLLIPLRSVCKRGCAPGNRAGKQCCGTGYKPNRAKTKCVRG